MCLASIVINLYISLIDPEKGKEKRTLMANACFLQLKHWQPILVASLSVGCEVEEAVGKLKKRNAPLGLANKLNL